MKRSDLEYIRQLNDLINISRDRIDILRLKALPGPILYDNTGASKPMPVNKTERIIELIEKEDKRMNDRIDKRYALKQQAIKEIRATCSEYEERHVLYLRYLSTYADGSALKWDDVIYYVNKYHNIKRAKIYQIHHDALRKVELYNI